MASGYPPREHLSHGEARALAAAADGPTPNGRQDELVAERRHQKQLG